MENTKKLNALIVFLLLTLVGVTALDIYQDRVIARQRHELRWLLTHSTIRPDVDPAVAANVVQGAKADAGPTQAVNVAPAPSPAKPASRVPPTAKP